MEQTQEIFTNNQTPPAIKVKSKKKTGCLIVLFLLLLFVVSVGGYYLLVLRPKLNKMTGEQLASSLNPEKTKIEAFYNADEALRAELLKDIQYPANLSAPPLFLEEPPSGKPVCGDDNTWMFLLVGTDYRGGDYLYGLADVIRLIRVDFVNSTINMVALPRDLMITMPEGRMRMPSPMKINQAYLAGTEGWGGYAGEGFGANSLAEAIDYNFGVTSEHYMVVNFSVVEGIINAVGGVDVNLPQSVFDEDLGYFPEGPQHLTGNQALDLMRIRKNYSDGFRVGNQTIVLKAMFQALKGPETILRIPALVEQFSNNILTDLTPGELISIGTCVIKNFDTNAINDKQIPLDLMDAGQVYIPSLNGNSFVYQWGDDVVTFIHNALKGRE